MIDRVDSAFEMRLIFLNVDEDDVNLVGDQIDALITEIEEDNNVEIPYVRLDVVDVTPEIVVADEDLLDGLDQADPL